MDKIPTAKDFMDNYTMEYKDGESPLVWMLRDFTKLHVKAALEAAAEKAETEDDGSWGLDEYYEHTGIDKDSILNAYPENLIK